MTMTRKPLPPVRSAGAALRTFCQSASTRSDAARKRPGRAKQREHPEQVVVENLSSVVVGQEVEGLEHRDEVVRGSLGERIEDCRPRSRCFGAKDHLIDAVLLDRRRQEVRLIGARVHKEIGRGVPHVLLSLAGNDPDRTAALFAGGLTVLDQSRQRAAAVTDDDLERRGSDRRRRCGCRASSRGSPRQCC